MQIITKNTRDLIPYARNPRENDDAVSGVAASIKEFGFLQPIVIDAENVVVAGHTRLKAAQRLGLETVPTVCTNGLTPQQVKAFRLLDNKLHEKATWDINLLGGELEDLLDFDFDQFDVDFDRYLGDPVESPENEWKGMPEFDQNGELAHRVLKVYFENEQDFLRFVTANKLRVTDKTKAVWWPQKEKQKRGQEWSSEE